MALDDERGELTLLAYMALVERRVVESVRLEIVLRREANVLGDRDVVRVD